MSDDQTPSPLTEVLSLHDAVELLEIIHSSLSCEDEDGFRSLMDRLRQIVPYDYAIAGLAGVDANGMKPSFGVLNFSYPEQWIEQYFENGYFAIDPVIKEHFTGFRLQNWADTFKRYDPPKSFVSTAADFGLSKGYTHGARTQRGDRGSLFSLSGGTVEYSDRTEAIVTHVVPHLHQALERVMKTRQQQGRATLSDREREVLKWVASGKSTWDTSVILGISERTVNFHVQNILLKLDAGSRTHAVAIALEDGLISLD